MSVIDEPPPKQDASEKDEEKRKLVEVYSETDFSAEELFEDLNRSLSKEIERVSVNGGFCRYLQREVICPARDQNCQRSKILRGCCFYKGYREHEGIIGYFDYQIEDLEGKGVDISELVHDMEFVKEKISERDFLVADKSFKSLREKIETGYTLLKKKVLV